MSLSIDAQALREEQDKVKKDLQEQIKAAQATQGSTEDMLARADKAEQLTKQLQDQLQSSEKTSSGKLAQLASKLKDIEARNQVCSDKLQACVSGACLKAVHNHSSIPPFLPTKACDGKHCRAGQICRTNMSFFKRISCSSEEMDIIVALQPSISLSCISSKLAWWLHCL